MDEGLRMALGLALGLVILVLMITKTKIHVFLAVIICSIFIGLFGGMGQEDVIASITKGFGNSLSSIGIIIGFGVMLGKLLEMSGATRVMANTFIKIFGKNREEEALAISGFVTSLSIFCTSGFIILAPLMKALSKKTKKSVVALGIALAGGLVASHSLVPPAAGPIGVAGILNVNIGQFMLYGTVLSVPIILVSLIYGKYLGRKICQIPDGEGWTREYEPGQTQAEPEAAAADSGALSISPLTAFSPILFPILLILLKTGLKSAGVENGVVSLLGQPIVALALGLLIAIYGLMRRFGKSDTLNAMEEGLKASGKLMLLVGGGGALGMIIQNSGLGEYIASNIIKTSIPPLLLPFLIAALLRVAQGSGSVAMMTAASVVAPMIGTLNLNPVFAALAACIGAIPFSHFNDSYFWVINESIGISDTREQMRVWSVTTTLSGFAALAVLLVMNHFLG
ncbi:GntP family permease [Enterocloster asparagiformis]|uniref:GntP family permease n=1 Tax=Enterocloster asparagiformis TaxID=333367 RepID=A0A413FGW9_9FIRM|nr:gluconate:H+ symporter [Enterocloster asparagiformis]RGX30033.1 GntP family permease [Enterocloster asparagiformis]